MDCEDFDFSKLNDMLYDPDGVQDIAIIEEVIE